MSLCYLLHYYLRNDGDDNIISPILKRIHAVEIHKHMVKADGHRISSKYNDSKYILKYILIHAQNIMNITPCQIGPVYLWFISNHKYLSVSDHDWGVSMKSTRQKK